jgi:histidine ammonia-lyase
MSIIIHHNDIDIPQAYTIAHSKSTISLSDETKQLINKNRQYLDRKIGQSDRLIYGINTGFGSLCNVVISDDELERLQRNLVLSHACGMGDKVPLEIVRLIFLLKILNLSKAASGVRLQLIEHMIMVYNADIMPVIYTQGSLGASGDLAPLSHLAACLIGEGQCYYNGQIVDSHVALANSEISPIILGAKEGIALLNGTQFSLAYAIHILHHMHQLWSPMTTITAMSIDTFLCDITPYHYLLHHIRPHTGQIKVASELYSILEDSPLRNVEKSSVQDPYSFRCIPQVMGASWGAILHITEVVTIELNAVTDNPMVFDEADLIMSGGNFHAQPLALALDYLAIAIAELASISERRIYQLINGDRGLPPFLTRNAGINSGYMIAQYTAASIVSQNKQYCTPASVDSIVSSKGQEDHVSMAANAATKCIHVMHNWISVLAIEWNVAAQALDMRRPHHSAPSIERFYNELRHVVPTLGEDRFLHDDLTVTRGLLLDMI